MNRRKLTGIVASLVVAALGTFIILNYVNSSEKKAAPLAVQTVPVLKVTQSIPKGTPAEKLGAAVAVVQVPVAEKLADAAVDVNELTGLVANVDLLQGEQLVKTRFVPAAQIQKEEAGASNGLIGVWVALDPIRALAGRVTAGSQVAVFVSFNGVAAAQADPTAAVPTSHLILHKVPVLDVIGAVIPPTPTPGAPEPAAVVAVAQLQIKLGVDAAQAERLVFAATNGQLWLGDEPSDTVEDGTKIIERGNIYLATPLLLPAAPTPVTGTSPAADALTADALTPTTVAGAAPAPAPAPGAAPTTKAPTPAPAPAPPAKPAAPATPPTTKPAAPATTKPAAATPPTTKVGP